jgi:hypothetical protein
LPQPASCSAGIYHTLLKEIIIIIKKQHYKKSKFAKFSQKAVNQILNNKKTDFLRKKIAIRAEIAYYKRNSVFQLQNTKN